MMAVDVKRAERADIPSVAAALADAFFDDPVVGYVWPDDRKRRRRQETAFAGQMKTLWSRREVYTTYLEYLGTVTRQQGKGVGGAVLAPVLEQADAEGIPVWTWSSNERNLSFYHRHGFEVLDKLPFVKDGPTIYPIRREPRG